MSPRQMFPRSAILLTAIAAALSLLSWDAVAGTRDVSEWVLHSFGNGKDGYLPLAGLARDNDGNLYGSTSGYNGPQGIIFKLTRKGKFTALYKFHDGGTDSALLLDDAGNLYGTVPTDKDDRKGYVFRLSQDGILTKLHRFRGADGANPSAALIADGESNLYGTTSDTVYKLTPKNKMKVLHTFVGGSDGTYPLDELLRDGEGNLYGTTYSGGISSGCGAGQGCGTVFKITSNGGYSVLYRFIGTSDGGNPMGGLVRDKDGNLYGTTLIGGLDSEDCLYRCGVVFKVAPDGTETVLHAFAGGRADGVNPYDTLLLDKSGNLFGTTSRGGANDDGTVFQIAPDGTETILYSFGGADGAEPWAGLISDKKGNFFGTTTGGGAHNDGTVYEITGAENSAHRSGKTLLRKPIVQTNAKTRPH